MGGPPYEIALRGGRFLKQTISAADIPEGSALLIRGGLIQAIAPPAEPFEATLTIEAASLLRMATLNGARALGMEGGLIEAGRPADLVVVEPRDYLWPEGAAAEQVVWGVGRGEVRTVIVNGQVVVEEGRLTRVDVAEVMGRVREMARGLR